MKSRALVVIDVQHYFLNMHTTDLPGKIAAHIIASNYAAIAFTKFVNHPSSNHAKRLNWHKSAGPPDTELDQRLAAFLTSENVFPKDTYSALGAPGLIEYLNRNQIVEIDLCGIDTDSCVLATAFAAFDAGYETRVLEHLSASHSGPEYQHAGNLIIDKSIQARSLGSRAS